MWPFKSKVSLRKSGMFEGFTDWHSHILPGVDDGIKTMEDSLEVLREFEKLGVKKVWLTPHIMEDYPNETGHLKERFSELKSQWKGNVEIKLAAENMLDTLFEERLDKGDLLPIGEEGNHLLVETSYYTPPYAMDEMIDKAKSKGFHLILAHPERYRYMDEKDYKRLKGEGLLFQMNFLSLIGGYGETAKKKANWLLSNGMINFLGSDLHRLGAVMSNLDSSPDKKSSIELIKELARNPEII